jgi:SPFH domain / Band 7 family
MLHERVVTGMSGWTMLVVLIAGIAGPVIALANAGAWDPAPWAIGLLVATLVVDGVLWFGLTVVPPNTARVLLLFGDYKGSIKTPGFWWVNPFTTRRAVSLKVRNFESGKLKVNDHIGNPIEIAAIVVWRVVETAEAVFQVDDYEHFVHVQTESAVRNLASTFPYDAHVEGELSLRGSGAEVSQRLRQEIHDRLSEAGVEVIEARISHLAYAPEIASAMLRRQQATAIIAARQKIVEGAVSMVEMALDHLNTKQIVRLDEERKAAMVSNLLVVLCSDRDAQPVVNTGTLYQ